MSARPLYRIAQDIAKAWPRPYFGAVPYLTAMRALTSPSDNYGADSGKSIVLYFLANAATFRGEQARALKAELRAAIGEA